MIKPDFYLSSSEGYNLEEVRKVFIIKQLRGLHRNDFLLVLLEPAIIGQNYGLGGTDISEVVLVPRLVGESLAPIIRWPVSVHVARPLVGDLAKKGTISDDEIKLIAWAEVWPTEEDARRK